MWLQLKEKAEVQNILSNKKWQKSVRNWKKDTSNLNERFPLTSGKDVVDEQGKKRDNRSEIGRIFSM